MHSQELGNIVRVSFTYGSKFTDFYTVFNQIGESRAQAYFGEDPDHLSFIRAVGKC